MLASLPYDFDYPVFALALLIMGLGNGMFGTPNIAAIMNSVPPEDRGVASGMRSMLQNSGMVISMALFFTIVIVSLTHLFPPELATSLTSAGAPDLIVPMSAIPPTGALFAAFLGYNPVNAILATFPGSCCRDQPGDHDNPDRHHLVPDNACACLHALAQDLLLHRRPALDHRRSIGLADRVKVRSRDPCEAGWKTRRDPELPEAPVGI